jgi:uncharacterized protein (TIRG00374 family)
VRLQHWRGRLILGFVLALVVVLGLAFYGDLPRLLEAFRRWQWAYLPLVLAAVLANYGLRFLRWHYYLGVIGVKDVGWRDSLGIFLSGFALTMTPGKVGEVLKSFLLKQVQGTPVSYSASIVVAERLTDVLGMVLLASVGLTSYRFGAQVLAVTLAIGLLFVLAVQQRTLVLSLLGAIDRLPTIGRFAGLLRNLYESAYLLLHLKPLVGAIALATISWFGECLAFFLVLLGLGLAPTAPLLLQATFIYALASLVGAISFLPGGLGATEAGMAVLLPRLVGLGKDAAVAATLLVRFATLWFAVALGLVALVVMQRRMALRAQGG